MSTLSNDIIRMLFGYLSRADKLSLALVSRLHYKSFIAYICESGWLSTVVVHHCERGHHLALKHILGVAGARYKFSPGVLEIAIKNGHLEVVRVLTWSKFPIYYYYLFTAIRFSQVKIIEFILSTRPDLFDSVDPIPDYALDEAVRIGNSKVVRALLNDQRIEPTSDCICRAARLGYKKILKMLVMDPRANLAPIPGKVSPLRYACANRHYNCVKLLLADPRTHEEIAICRRFHHDDHKLMNILAQFCELL